MKTDYADQREETLSHWWAALFIICSQSPLWSGRLVDSDSSHVQAGWRCFPVFWHLDLRDCAYFRFFIPLTYSAQAYLPTTPSPSLPPRSFLSLPEPVDSTPPPSTLDSLIEGLLSRCLSYSSPSPVPSSTVPPSRTARHPISTSPDVLPVVSVFEFSDDDDDDEGGERAGLPDMMRIDEVKAPSHRESPPLPGEMTPTTGPGKKRMATVMRSESHSQVRASNLAWGQCVARNDQKSVEWQREEIGPVWLTMNYLPMPLSCR